MDSQQLDLLIAHLQARGLTDAEIAELGDHHSPEELRKWLGELDLQYYGRAYFPHYLTSEPPDFHAEVLGDLQAMVEQGGGGREAVAAPRGHAKSTIVDLVFLSWCVTYQRKHYALLVSDSLDQAKGQLANLKTELEQNETLRADFGDLVGEIWSETVIVTTTGIKVEAVGAKMKLRGRRHGPWRPDLVIVDDLENDENVATPDQRKKLRAWFFKALSKVGARYTDIVVIGTILDFDSLLAGLLRNPGYRARKYQAIIKWSSRVDLWAEWERLFTDLTVDKSRREHQARAYFEARRAEMLAGTQVLWEANLDYYALMVINVVEGPAAFDSEYQNEPFDPEEAYFREEWLEQHQWRNGEVTPADCDVIVGFLDPSLGRTRTSDFSAIITLGRHAKTGRKHVLDADIERRAPDKIIADLFDKAQRYKYTAFGIESVQFQAYFAGVVAQKSAEAGIYLPVEEVDQVKDKILRIQTLQPDLKNGYISLHASQTLLWRQLKFFPRDSHDDGPDALEGANSLMNKYAAAMGSLQGFGERQSATSDW